MALFSAMRRLRRDTLTPGLRAAIAAGVLLHVAGIALIGATWRLPPPPSDEPVFVRFSDAQMNERAEMLDPGPLFLPTALNHGALRAGDSEGLYGVRPSSGNPDEPPLAPPRRGEPDPAAPPLRAEAVYPSLRTGYPSRRIVDATPAATADLFIASGRRAPEVATLPAAGPRYRVIDALSGREVASGRLAGLGDIRSSSRLLRPAEFGVESGPYGMSAPSPVASLADEAGGPAPVTGTGDAAIDARIIAAVAAALAESPPPEGRYRVIATL